MASDGSDSTRSLRLLLLGVGLLIAVVYAQILLFHARGRWVAPLRDDLIFYQYARSLADGHPYRFFPDAERTTGSTSHLYVFVLAALYRLGLKGDALAAGAFGLNVALWLATLLLVYATARRLFARVAFAAALLVALTGPIGFGFFAGHDMGLVTTLFFLALYGLASQRAALAAVALFLMAWARPEGFLVSLALVAVSLAAPAGKRRPSWAIAGVAGLLGFAGVLVFNFALTGEIAFTSMQGKGVIGPYPLHAVSADVSQALGAIVREILLGWDGGARGLYFLPLIGVALLFGFVPRCRLGSIEVWLLASTALVTLLVAASGFAGLQHDKYLIWILALVALYAVAGLPVIEEVLGGRIRWPVLFGLCAIYGLVGTAYFWGDFGRRAVEEHALLATVEKARPLLPPGARVGVLAGSGIQYYLPDHEVINLNGVTHRRFVDAWEKPPAQVEILEAHPELRPEVWLLGDSGRERLERADLVGAVLFSSPAFLGAQAHSSFFAARYDRLSVGDSPLVPSVVEAVRDRQLVDEIDLGLPEHERAHDYARFTRAAGTRLAGTVVNMDLEGRDIVEAGYAILGDEEFRIHVRTGQDLWVVVRTSRRITAFSLLGSGRGEAFDLTLTPPVRVDVLADGQKVPLDPAVFTPSGEGLDERILRIPARYVQGDTLRLRIAGDHIAYHYWFYQ